MCVPHKWDHAPTTAPAKLVWGSTHAQAASTGAALPLPQHPSQAYASAAVRPHPSARLGAFTVLRPRPPATKQPPHAPPDAARPEPPM